MITLREGNGTSDILSVRLQETLTLELFQQDNESVDTREEKHQCDVQKWEMYTKKKQMGVVRIREVSSQTAPRISVDKNTQKAPIEYKESSALVTLSDMHDEFQRLGKESEPFKHGSVYSQRAEERKQKYYGDLLNENGGEKDEHRGKSYKREDGINAYSLLTALGWIERMLSSAEYLKLIHLFACDKDLLSSGRKVSMSSAKAKTEELWKFTSDKCQSYRVNCITFFSSTPWLLIAGCGNLKFGTKGAIVGWNVKRICQPEIWIEMPSPVTAVSSCPESPQYCAAAMLDGSLRVYQLDRAIHPLVLDTCGSPDKHFAPIWWVEWRDSQVVNSMSKGDIRGPSFRRLVSALKASAGPKVSIAQVLVSASEDGTVKEWLFSSEDGLLTCCTLLRIYLPSWLSIEIAGGKSSTFESKDANNTCTSLPVQNHLGERSEFEKMSQEKSLHKHIIKERNEGDSTSKVGSTKRLPKKENENQFIPQVGDLDGIEGILSSQLVPATSISFRPGSKTDYLLGTVAGDVLLCRTFERDRVRQVYRGHTGRVSHVCWRPTGEDPTNIFLSAALDETIRVWHINKPDFPLCILRIPKSQGAGYLDTKWCPWYGNLIAGVHTKGLHLWDISLSPHMPILSHAVPNATCTSFSRHTRNILVGDSNGKIHVIHLQGLQESPSMFFKYATSLSKLTRLSVAEATS